jgi:hypothetical protein
MTLNQAGLTPFVLFVQLLVRTNAASSCISHLCCGWLCHAAYLHREQQLHCAGYEGEVWRFKTGMNALCYAASVGNTQAVDAILAASPEVGPGSAYAALID